MAANCGNVNVSLDLLISEHQQPCVLDSFHRLTVIAICDRLYLDLTGCTPLYRGRTGEETAER